MRGERGKEVFSTQVKVGGEHPQMSGFGEQSVLTATPFGTNGGKQALPPPLPAIFNYVPHSPSAIPGWTVSMFYGQIFDRAMPTTKCKNHSMPLCDTVFTSTSRALQRHASATGRGRKRKVSTTNLQLSSSILICSVSIGLNCTNTANVSTKTEALLFAQQMMQLSVLERWSYSLQMEVSGTRQHPHHLYSSTV